MLMIAPRMNAKESITTFLRKTNFRVWRERGTTFLGKLNVKESIMHAEESIMNAEESITSFFRRIGRERETTYVGELDGKIVASRQPVIIFQYPHILQTAATVEDATTLLVKLSEGNAANQAVLYKHDTDRWQRVNTPSITRPSDSTRPDDDASAMR